MPILKKNLLINDVKEFIINNKNNYLLENELLDYYEEYGKKNKYEFSYVTFESEKKKLIFPYTLDKNSNLDFFGMPAIFFCQVNIIIFNNDLKKFFEKLRSNKKIIFNLKIEKNFNDLQLLLSQAKKNEEIYEESFIDLKLSDKEIFKQFSKGHRYEINRNTNFEYKIIDWNNYKKNQILEMMNLHETVSGKITRSKKSWMINEEMILKKKGFLVFVTHLKKLISSSFFFKNNFSSIYFSSCTIRDYFLKTGITHKTIWQAIQYLKKNNCYYLHLGRTKTYFASHENIKERNIEKFKNSFGGIKKIYLKTFLTPETFQN